MQIQNKYGAFRLKPLSSHADRSHLYIHFNILCFIRQVTHCLDTLINRKLIVIIAQHGYSILIYQFRDNTILSSGLGLEH